MHLFVRELQEEEIAQNSRSGMIILLDIGQHAGLFLVEGVEEVEKDLFYPWPENCEENRPSLQLEERKIIFIRSASVFIPFEKINLRSSRRMVHEIKTHQTIEFA
jgi:hypothetical protein